MFPCSKEIKQTSSSEPTTRITQTILTNTTDRQFDVRDEALNDGNECPMIMLMMLIMIMEKGEDNDDGYMKKSGFRVTKWRLETIKC